jgi:hypothetical protein
MDDLELHILLNSICVLVELSIVSSIYIYNFKPFINYSISAVLNNLLQSASVQYESVRSDMQLMEEL